MHWGVFLLVANKYQWSCHLHMTLVSLILLPVCKIMSNMSYRGLKCNIYMWTFKWTKGFKGVTLVLPCTEFWPQIKKLSLIDTFYTWNWCMLSLIDRGDFFPLFFPLLLYLTSYHLQKYLILCNLNFKIPRLYVHFPL